MGIKVGINGFGRIGRNMLRASLDRADIDIVAVNDLTDAETLAHLLRHDSIHGAFPREVAVDGDWLVVGSERFQVLSVRNPVSDLASGKPNALLAAGAIVLLLVIVFAIVKGTLRTIKPVGGEERFAMVATGVSVQLGVMLLLGIQLGFLLLGQTTDEVWAGVFRVIRLLV